MGGLLKCGDAIENEIGSEFFLCEHLARSMAFSMPLFVLHFDQTNL